MASTPVLLHEHDEALSVATFLQGVKVYEAIIPALANAPADTEAKAAAANTAGAAPVATPVDGSADSAKEPAAKKARA
jgi:hypothetical protein